jgi:hypothetical protein
VAVLVSHVLPVVRLPSVVPGRHTCVQATFADLGDILFVSYYVHVSDVRQRDDDLVAVLRQLASAGKPFILAGDFNTSLAQVAALDAGILPKFGVLAPRTSTCISATGQSLIDFFLVHGSLFGACGEAAIVHHGSSPHLPVSFTLRSEVFSQAITFLKRPKVARTGNHVVGPVGAALGTMNDIVCLLESLGHFTSMIGLHPDVLTRRASIGERERLHQLSQEFLRILTPL